MRISGNELAADNKCKIVLNEEGTLVTETSKVSEIFNEFFTHVADSIGKDFVFTPETHPSIMKIKENYENVDTFNFKVIEDTVVDKIIRSLSSKKAVGADKISAKLLKAGRESFTPLITSLVNNTLCTSIFPDRLKEAQVTPLYKKNDPLDKKNYRPAIYQRFLRGLYVIKYVTILNKFLTTFYVLLEKGTDVKLSY